MDFKFIDTHAHLNLSAFKEDFDVVAKQCADEGVAVINVGTKESTSKRGVELANEYDNMYSIIGLHPIQTVPMMHDEDEIGEGGEPFKSKGEVFVKDFYRELAKSEKVVGIGECGFDYWHTEPDSYAVQEEAFIAQIELANELNLPLMIHTRGPKPGQDSPTGRSVYADVYDTLQKYAKVPFNVHFYAGTLAEAEKFFELGGTISFTGVITFAKDYEEVVRNAPLDLIHGETDCPYVAPVPHRGKRCEPWMVQEVYKKIAEIKEMDEEVVREQLIENAKRHYNLK
ncbi:TatD family hydrolase [Candidatus Nomurabacteria bacterium]|nr:TatD family hydrolase [Candidatus Nomurabacteria bacterium]MCB9818059.1 TatD family hydrolase [Candidatus Nomurabacteria bacterium]